MPVEPGGIPYTDDDIALLRENATSRTVSEAIDRRWLATLDERLAALPPVAPDGADRLAEEIVQRVETRVAAVLFGAVDDERFDMVMRAVRAGVHDEG